MDQLHGCTRWEKRESQQLWFNGRDSLRGQVTRKFHADCPASVNYPWFRTDRRQSNSAHRVPSSLVRYDRIAEQHDSIHRAYLLPWCALSVGDNWCWISSTSWWNTKSFCANTVTPRYKLLSSFGDMHTAMSQRESIRVYSMNLSCYLYSIKHNILTIF